MCLSIFLGRSFIEVFLRDVFAPQKDEIMVLVISFSQLTFIKTVILLQTMLNAKEQRWVTIPFLKEFSEVRQTLNQTTTDQSSKFRNKSSWVLFKHRGGRNWVWGRLGKSYFMLGHGSWVLKPKENMSYCCSISLLIGGSTTRSHWGFRVRRF